MSAKDHRPYGSHCTWCLERWPCQISQARSETLVEIADLLEDRYPDPNPLASVFSPYVVTTVVRDLRTWAGLSCGRCRQAFDATDTRFDGHARYGETAFCRECVDRCHDSEIADHRCPVCS